MIGRVVKREDAYCQENAQNYKKRTVHAMSRTPRSPKLSQALRHHTSHRWPLLMSRP